MIKKPIFIIILLTFIPTLILMFLLSSDPLFSLYAFITGPFSNSYSFNSMLTRATPLILTSIGAFIALKTNSFNLGGEGQVYLGATLTGILAVYFKDFESPVTLILIIIAALLATGAVTWFSAWLEIKYKISSLITTYLLSMITIHICNFFVTNPFLKANSNILTTENIPNAYTVNSGFIIAVIIAAIIAFLLKQSLLGFELSISGKNRVFADSMGINSVKYKYLGLTMSGALHGAAGVLLVLGNYNSVIVGFYNGLGWNGLSSALLAGNSPITVILTSLFYAYLDTGASYATITSDITIEISAIIKSILFFVISSKLIKNSMIKRSKV